MTDVTRILSDLAQGDAHAAARNNLGFRLARVPFIATLPEANSPQDPKS